MVLPLDWQSQLISADKRPAPSFFSFKKLTIRITRWSLETNGSVLCPYRKCSRTELRNFHVKNRNYEQGIKSLWVWTIQTMEVKITKNKFTHAISQEKKAI